MGLLYVSPFLRHVYRTASDKLFPKYTQTLSAEQKLPWLTMIAATHGLRVWGASWRR